MSYTTDTDGLFTAGAVAQIEATHGVDPEHPRTVIREFFAARLSAALTSSLRLHSDPTLAIQGRAEQFELPALNLTTRSESSEPWFKGPFSMQHTLEMGVDIYGAETDLTSVERLLDAIALGVETLVLDETSYPTSIHEVRLASTERSFTTEGLRRMGECRLLFTVIYTSTLES